MPRKKPSKKQPNSSVIPTMSRLKSMFRLIFRKKPTVAVIRLSGIIGQSGVMGKGLNLDELRPTIDRAFNINHVKAIALQINSPGGSPVQSELISCYITECAKEKNIPVFSFAEDVAASGGYWLLCTGQEIYASAASMIGSIGVISSGFGYVDTLKKLGIERRVYTEGETKNILDPFKPEDKKGIEILKNAQKDVHNSFKNMVKKHRNNKLKAPDNELFNGAFWTGKKAMELGLIDGVEDLYLFFKKKYGKRVRFIKVNKTQGLLKRYFSSAMAICIDLIASKLIELNLYSRYK